ncbi:protein phosphatase Slingshot isoform X2 [Teleopsis dalmanni]|uniref:protein phosphatase Slingshot isoform X2 n=1 Tax=Teleopsis dalmanni TaxID=139649 RepID=UPI0018CF5A1A|nr:protein phosphatase Slingshot isoform X2 [Teleopsis dalmanni]
MALVTVQRSPIAGSPRSNSDGEADDEDGNRNEKSECFFAGKGTALVLALKDIPQHSERRLSTDSTRSTNSTQSNNSDIQQHLQSMFNLLKHEETLKMAVKLESHRPNRTRYLVIASRCCFRSTTTDRKHKVTRNNSTKSAATLTSNANTRQNNDLNCNKTQQQLQQSQTDASDNLEAYDKRLSGLSTYLTNRQSVKCDDKYTAGGDNKCADGIEESCLLGIDCNERTTLGLVVPILADTTIHLDGDGGFSVSVYGKTHIFKPVSVQAMWSALQTLHKVSHKARENNFYPGGPSHDWLSYYEQRVESDQSCLNEWNAMDSLESRRPPSPDAIRNKPTAKEETESVIKMKLKEIMMSVDLDEVTSKYIRGRLEEHLDMDLGEYKSFIDTEMLLILGQMDAPTEIFDHVYLGSEWNASNLEELQKNGVRHILNVTREIDNFFPGIFDYFNVRVYDDEKTNLLKHWDNTYRYISRAKSEGSKVLVHCKMGVSRSASVVIAYAMKAYNWEFEHALQHVKERRSCIKPNKNFLNQLETYRGMLDAMKNKEKLQRSKSETNLKSTKDARLLPGSEPTPLIQALNQSKSKSAGHGVSVEVGDCETTEANEVNLNCERIAYVKTRLLLRRSNSISPKSSIQSHNVIVMKQQSQSLENLTPERSIADEPKNVRFPGSNGENYSVTQNQVLHIQKKSVTIPTSGDTALPPNSVRTIVHDLEAVKDRRKTVDDRKVLNLQFGRSVSHDAATRTEENLSNNTAQESAHTNITKSPVWTSSAKLITQTSNLKLQQCDKETENIHPALRKNSHVRRNSSSSNNDPSADMFSSQLDNVFANEEEKRHRRKTQSWAATSGSSGGIILESNTLINSGIGIKAKGSNSSIDSASSSTTSTIYEGVVRTRPRQRELPSRHASWGSGDNRCGVPIRNSSWGPYDTNRNTFQYGGTANSAIFEGQIHELNMSNKTVNYKATNERQQNQHSHIGTVKRTKQKLEECTVQKKLCQENGESESDRVSEEALSSPVNTTSVISSQKKGSNLYRSASAAGGTARTRFPHRCNSEEIVPTVTAVVLTQATTRRSDGNKPIQSELFSASAPESYTMSDIENKNLLPQENVEDSSEVLLRTNNLQQIGATAEDQRISGNVQILKKSFEAKAGGTATTAATQANLTASSKKGHQSLPSSPVAQHVDHSGNIRTTVTISVATTTTTTAISNVEETTTAVPTKNTSSNSSNSSSSSSVSDTNERNVKGLVHKYQTTTPSTAASSASNTPAITTVVIDNG